MKTWAKPQKSSKLTVLKKASPGAFKSYYFCLFIHVYMCCNNLFICAFKFSGVVYNHRRMFLGYDKMLPGLSQLDAWLIGPVKVE